MCFAQFTPFLKKLTLFGDPDILFFIISVFSNITASSTTKEYSDLFNNGSMRAARNEDGKTYYVPADMTYREWEKKSIVQKPKGKSSGKGNDLNKTKLPKLIKIIDFNDKIAIMKETEDFEKNAVELPCETNCTVTADGKVWNIDGTDGFQEVLKILSKKYNFKYKREKNDK